MLIKPIIKIADSDHETNYFVIYLVKVFGFKT